MNYFLSEGAWDVISLSFSNDVFNFRLFPVLCDQKDFSFCQLNNQFLSSGNVTPTKHLLFGWRDFSGSSALSPA